MSEVQEPIQETPLQEEPSVLTKIVPIEPVEVLGRPLDTVILHVVQTTIAGTLQEIIPGAMQGLVVGLWYREHRPIAVLEIAVIVQVEEAMAILLDVAQEAPIADPIEALVTAQEVLAEIATGVLEEVRGVLEM
jgi:hypothetical protein